VDIYTPTNHRGSFVLPYPVWMPPQSQGPFDEGDPLLAKFITHIKMVELMTIVCAWCGKRLKQGSAQADVSHGICPACLRGFESRVVALWPALRSGRARRKRRATHPTLPLPGFEPA